MRKAHENKRHFTHSIPIHPLSEKSIKAVQFGSDDDQEPLPNFPWDGVTSYLDVPEGVFAAIVDRFKTTFGQSGQVSYTTYTKWMLDMHEAPDEPSIDLPTYTAVQERLHNLGRLPKTKRKS